MALVGQWLLAAAPGGITPDSSGNSYNGTIVPVPATGCPVVADRGPNSLIPKSMFWDAGNGYIVIPSAAHQATVNFSWSAWIHPLDLHRRTIISAGNTANTPTFSMSVMGGESELEVTIPGIYVYTSSYAGIVANRWQHVAFTRAAFDGTIFPGCFYVNGRSISIYAPLSHPEFSMVASTVNVYLGCRDVGSQLWFGDIADVRAYNHTLTPSEVREIYAQSLKQNFALLGGV